MSRKCIARRIIKQVITDEVVEIDTSEFTGKTRSSRARTNRTSVFSLKMSADV